jgi:hypothetical protein
MAATYESIPSRPQSDALRLGLFLLPGLASAYTFAILFGPSSSTGSFFAWRMPPLSAATIGACYGGSCLMDILAARSSDWVSVRSAVPPVVLLLGLTVVAVVREPAQLHLGGGAIFVFVSAWVWLGLNGFLAVGALVGIAVQVRQGGEARRGARMPAAMTGFLVAFGGGLGGFGVALLARPRSAGWWPWQLGPLEAMLLGAWLLALAAGTLVSAWEGDLWRIAPAVASLAGAGGLGLIALARYPGALNWSAPGAWFYLCGLVLATVVGAVGLVLGGPLRSRRT